MEHNCGACNGSGVCQNRFHDTSGPLEALGAMVEDAIGSPCLHAVKEQVTQVIVRCVAGRVRRTTKLQGDKCYGRVGICREWGIPIGEVHRFSLVFQGSFLFPVLLFRMSWKQPQTLANIFHLRLAATEYPQ